ncbi:MAG: tRNA (adenosine(37)-N6)-threonylcarbamoyltransferase complex dimerization subunit type 1 TsaB [Bacteroidetes bacterium]|nr:tRNA (adenosine(37)-N6)-threonylcarbamoyltransferase complex dimerization subunit type 1 TsaB [Bacteroidota bacterium]
MPKQSPLILCLETSTKICSVALGQNGNVVALKESSEEKYSHAENLTVYIQEVCSQAKISLKDIDAVAVSKGPGSFTGLRIGVSTAKGLCYALEKPLIGINSLEAIAAGQVKSQKSKVKSLFAPMIDAKRMEVYCAVYDKELNEIKKTSAEIIDENSFSGLLGKNKIYFFGDGSAKCKSQIKHSNAVFIDDATPSAEFMIPIAKKYFLENKFEDLAYYEPFYLKDFVSPSTLLRVNSARSNYSSNPYRVIFL